MRYFVALMTIFLMSTTPVLAMDGYVSDSGEAVTVEDGTVFEEGTAVVVYNAQGVEHNMQVMSVNEEDESITVDLVDEDTGDAKTIEFVK